jgi:hypothetical protein
MGTSTSSSHQAPPQAGPRLAAKFEARRATSPRRPFIGPRMSDRLPWSLCQAVPSKFVPWGTVAGDG